jgi:hypothetical protein
MLEYPLGQISQLVGTQFNTKYHSTLTLALGLKHHHPQTERRAAMNAEKAKAFVKMSALFSSELISEMTMGVGESMERNQWYLTARDLERGVRRGGSVVARIFAARLSSNTVEIVESRSPSLSPKPASISKRRARMCTRLRMAVAFR